LSRSARSDLSSLILIKELMFNISQCYKFSKNAGYTLIGRLFVGLNHHIGMIWLLIRIIDTGEILDLSLVNELVEALDVALATNLDGALDIHLDKIPYLPARPFTCLAVRSNGSRDAHNVITCEQASYKCNALDVGIAVLAAKAKPLA